MEDDDDEEEDEGEDERDSDGDENGEEMDEKEEKEEGRRRKECMVISTAMKKATKPKNIDFRLSVSMMKHRVCV